MSVSTNSARARLVVIEDEPILLNLLQQLLTAEGYEVVGHTRAADAHLMVRKVQPHAVLLDLRLADEADPASAGWRVLDRLVLDTDTRDVPVVVASGATESIAARRPALLPHYGVRVLLKPYDLDQLLAVLAEAVGAAPLAPRPASQRAASDQLTARQREIARLIALGYTNAQIAARLVLECGTVANHVAKIMQRLGVGNRAQVAVWAARQGLVEEPSAPEPAPVA